MKRHLSLDEDMFQAGIAIGKEAGAMNAISSILRQKKPVAGAILLSTWQRDMLCQYLDDTAKFLDELSLAVQQDSEDGEPMP